MPLLISKDSGLAENLADQQAQQAVQSGTHEVPMVDPNGELGSVPYENASDAISQGYSQPSQEQLNQLHRYGKYSTTEQQAKTFLEGAASASTLGLSTAAERGLGVRPEDINARADINPVAHGAGEAAGLVGSLATGVGEGALLGRAAETLVPSGIGKVGGAITKAAIENMMFQSGDEASKMIASDPNQSVETALAHIGMAGLIGGGFGAAGAAWSAGPGRKLSTLMTALKDRSAGIPEELRVGTGIEIPPEVAAGLSDNEYAQRAFAAAREGSSSSDKKVQEAFNSFKENMENAASTVLGKTPEDVEHIASRNISNYETGSAIKDMLSSKFKEIADPIAQSYDSFAQKFKGAPFTPEMQAEVANSIASKVTELGLDKAASDMQMKAAQNLLKVLPKQENANDLKMLAENLSKSNPYGSETYYVGKELKSIVRDAQDKAIAQSIGTEAPELMSEFQSTQQQYGEIKGLISDLNDRLHVGKSGGPESFLRNLKEAAPEEVLRRLGPKGDVELQKILENQFPEVSTAVKENELNKLVTSSAKDGRLNIKKLAANMERMGADLRNYAVSPEAQQKIAQMHALMERVPTSASFSQKIADKLWDKVPNAASGIAAMLLHHGNPVVDFLVGHTIGNLASEARGGARLALLKFLGSGAETSAEGLNAAAQMANAVAKGESKLNMSVRNVFSTGGKVIPMPKASALSSLDKQVQMVASNDPEHQQDMLNVGGQTGHYMPEHGAMLAMTASRNMQYLSSLRPVDKSPNPLAEDPMPSSTDQGKYDRALEIAQQPLIILQSVKNGSISTDDLVHLRTMYPALYGRMQQKLTEELTSKLTNGKTLPYATKMGLSSFMGMPLDASMAPAAIASTQPKPNAQPLSPQRAPAGNKDKLDKQPGASATPNQSRQMQRNKF